MTCESVALFSTLAGIGLGLLLALVGMWFVSKVTGEPMRYKPDPVLAGLEVSDSSMGEFEAARGRA